MWVYPSWGRESTKKYVEFIWIYMLKYLYYGVISNELRECENVFVHGSENLTTVRTR